jgi:hypothetical protein
MTSLSKTLLGAAMGAGVFAFLVVSASAAVVCNGNVCWHAKEKYTYPPDALVTMVAVLRGTLVGPCCWAMRGVGTTAQFARFFD